MVTLGAEGQKIVTIVCFDQFFSPPITNTTSTTTQGDREREMSIPVAPSNDRFTSNVAMTQMNFAEYLAFPLFLVLIQIFPSLEPLGRFIARNVGHWGQIRVNELVAAVQLEENKIAAAEFGEVLAGSTGAVGVAGGGAAGAASGAGAAGGGGGGNGDHVFRARGSTRSHTREMSLTGDGAKKRGVDLLEGMMEGERMECAALLKRGPDIDVMLTNALESLIVLNSTADV
jgi:hypothetical protein